MKTPKYICAKCRQPFTRRWNAYRHSNNKHFGSIENIISFTDYLTNQKNSSLSLNYFSEDKNSYPRNVNNHLFFDNSISAKNIQSSTLTDPCDNLMDHLFSPYELLAQLGPKYEEMRRILDCFPEPVRSILLGNTLSFAINSNDPVDTMNKKLSSYRKFVTSEMMLKDLAACYGSDQEYIKTMLKLKFKRKEYYRQNFANKIY